MFWSRNELERNWVRARHGDPEAWAKVVENLSSLAYSCAKKCGLGPDDCDDVHQTTFIALYKSMDQIEEAAVLPKWISVTASREAIRTSKRRAREVAASNLNSEQSLDDVMAEEDEDVEKSASSALMGRQALTALQSLGGKCRELLSMLYLPPTKNYAEISDSLSMPIGSIGPTRSRCLEKLRSILAREGFFE